MDRHSGNSPTFFARSAYGFKRRLRPVTIFRSPAPQICISTNSPIVSSYEIYSPIPTVFELPDELILHILSYISPEPRLTGHYARFREQYRMQINDDHQERMCFLRPLSMTCRLMRLRLLPFMWNLIEPSRVCWYDCMKRFGWNLAVIVNALHADRSLAASVRYFCGLL